jgi:hypothetical protein
MCQRDPGTLMVTCWRNEDPEEEVAKVTQGRTRERKGREGT